ncbi:MAG: exodeoxyribonuclease VII large subunit [Bacteroidales bacterium]|jgi:exodeoxyribonuclease VII large subunit
MNDKLSLAELQLIIRDSIYTALPGLYWVSAEISDIRENFAGHCYLELVEKHPDDENIRAKARAVIWGNRYRFIKHLFEQATGETLRSGLKVLVHIKIEYHEVYGLSLVINDIDPAFTLGEMAIKRQQILKKLEEEGVISMNRDLIFPIMPKRIAVISSKNAAGLTDFLKHLDGNSYGYRFNTALFEAAMQGADTEEGIISALNRISEHIELFNVVVIVRGGGSQSDLSWFDNYNIAYHITQFPLPVVTGIGHEKDLSVTDIVAHRSEKTPTAVADLLIGTMAATEEHIIETYNEISSFSLSIIEDARARIDSCRMKLIPVARMKLNNEKNSLSGRMIRLINTGKDFVVREGITPVNHTSRLYAVVKTFTGDLKSKLGEMRSAALNNSTVFLRQKQTELNSLTNTVNLLSPEKVLQRGYTITSMNGKILTSSETLKRDDTIDTLFSDGKVSSMVTSARKSIKDTNSKE